MNHDRPRDTSSTRDASDRYRDGFVARFDGFSIGSNDLTQPGLQRRQNALEAILTRLARKAA